MKFLKEFLFRLCLVVPIMFCVYISFVIVVFVALIIDLVSSIINHKRDCWLFPTCYKVLTFGDR